jgi:hypothetical protein
LVFVDKATLGKLAELRRVRSQDRDGTNSLVEQVTVKDGSNADAHQDVADRITGRIRHKQQAPKTSGGRADTEAPAPPPEPAGVRPEDDPLRGL